MDEADYMILAMIHSQGQMDFDFQRVPMPLRFRLANLVIHDNIIAEADGMVTQWIEGRAQLHVVLSA